MHCFIQFHSDIPESQVLLWLPLHDYTITMVTCVHNALLDYIWTMYYGEGLATMFISRQLLWLCVQLQWLLVNSCPSKEVMQSGKHRGICPWQPLEIKGFTSADCFWLHQLWLTYGIIIFSLQLRQVQLFFFSLRSVHAWCFETACDSEKHMCGQHWGVSKLIFVQFSYNDTGPSHNPKPIPSPAQWLQEVYHLPMRCAATSPHTSSVVFHSFSAIQ